MRKIDKSYVASCIEHTLLRAGATRKDILKLCEETIKFNFHGVCVNPVFVEEASKYLKETDCSVVTVIGFPLGATFTHVKTAEARWTVQMGANEIDTVMNISALKSGNHGIVHKDIRNVVNAVSSASIPVKVIIETCLLTDSEKISACLLAYQAGATFIKTSTGFSTKGVTIEDVRLMKSIVGEKMGVKAAGGIHDFQTAVAMLEAGATRLGCSDSVKIMEE